MDITAPGIERSTDLYLSFPLQWKQRRDTRYKIDTNFNVVCYEKEVPNGVSMLDVEVKRRTRKAVKWWNLLKMVNVVTNGDVTRTLWIIVTNH